MVTLLYKRQNMIEEVIADLFGVSQGTDLRQSVIVKAQLLWLPEGVGDGPAVAR